MPEQRSVKSFKIKKDDLQYVWSIFQYVKPYKWYFFAGLMMLLVSSMVSMVFPYVTGKLVDISNGEKVDIINNINTVALILLGILVFNAILSYGRVILFAIVSEGTMADIRNKLYEKLITLSIGFYEQRRVGELTSRITADVTQLQQVLSFTLAQLIRQISVLLIGIVIIFFISWRLTLMMLATFPVIVVVTVFFGRYIRKLSMKTQDALADANVVVEETLQSIQIVKAFTNEAYESKRYNVSIEKVKNYALKAARYRGGFSAFIVFGLFGGIVLVLWYGAWLIEQDVISAGDLISFIIYTLFIGGAVGTMGDLYASVQKAIGSTERIKDILEEETEVQQEDIKDQVVRLNGDILYKDIQFSYPTRKDIEVLKGLDLSIPQGDKIALVGPSGAGKSTIVQLLMRFYEIDSGEISIGGNNIQSINISQLRQNIGIVPQEVILFGGTIKENIGYGKPNATDAEIYEAAKKANALEFIDQFPEKLETIVGERGVKLSGGQRQRIAIARAILKDPAILILDEATSSLDASSEKLVQAALDELMENRTTIVIAHRLATIRKVDCIYVLQDGQIIEAGTHIELAEKEDGLYQHLLKLQFEKA